MLERFFEIRSIKGKLTAVMMATTGIVLLLVTLAFVVNETVTFRTAIHRELKTLAKVVGLNTTAAITFWDRKSAEATLAALAARPNLTSAYILTPDGAVFAQYLSPEASGEGILFIVGNGQQQLRDNRAALAELEREAHRTWEWDRGLEVVERVMLDNQEIGVVVIRSDLGELFARLKWFFVFVLIITVIALGVALLLSGMMHRPISGPILDLAMTMKKVSEDKEYTLRAQKRSSDEVGQLITGFNEMLAQIQDRDAALERYTVELQNSNAELKSFIYSAAHDLRQPLVNIKGFTHELVRSLQDIQTLLRRNAESLPEVDRSRLAALLEDDVQASSGFIVSSVERMASLINALLKLSQLSYRDLRPEPISMEALVRSSLRDMHRQIQEKNVSVTVGDLPDVTADRATLDQIMGNLLDNAVRYLDSRRPGRIEISGERTSAGVIYRVRDNGRGIAAADISKVFDLFRRAGKPDITRLGVGLAYVRALVRLHGGRIWCESEEDVGSTFSFVIPLDYRSPRPPQEKI